MSRPVPSAWRCFLLRFLFPGSLLCSAAFFLGFLLPWFFSPPVAFVENASHAEAKLPLHDGWTLQSSCAGNAGGDQISRAGFSTSGWHSTSVPATVVAALVADKTYPDPYFGTNLPSLPGGDYPRGKNFSLLPMPKDSPFRCSWWYRTEFPVPREYAGRYVWIHFGGINYRANIWLNGQKIAGDRDVAGAYRTYEFEISKDLDWKGANALAVETFAQTENDLGINWVDWNPAPPDKDMGLWREVFLRASGPVTVRYPFVRTHFPQEDSLEEADLSVGAELRNASKAAVSGTLEGSIDELRFQQAYTLKPGETREVGLTPQECSTLRIRNPKLWWPYAMGGQNLHSLALKFVVGNETSDAQTVRVGFREIRAELDANGHRLFRVNGEKILIRGAGWTPDMLLRLDPRRLDTDFQYVRDLNLNTIRLEGKMETEEFFNLADEQGILVMAGWCCCDHWEEWKKWKPGDLNVATDSVRSQSLRMRSHPSLLVWLNGSDNPPPPNVEKSYLLALEETGWPNPVLSSASQAPSSLTGPSGVKMTGPYDYVPPDYWLADTTKFGGAFGFNTETGPGPAVPPWTCLKKFLPEQNIRPDDPVWNYHAGLEGFQNLRHFDGAMDAIYGKPLNFHEYEIKAQAMAYDAERAMFEAYSRNKYTSTGLIQWMLNNGWPSLIWHLYDYYLEPAGAYFGAKKGSEPLHVQYSYDDRTVVVVNNQYEKYAGLELSAKLYDVNLKELFSRQAVLGVEADGVERAFVIPEEAFAKSSPIYFLGLELRDIHAAVISSNFYWLSSKRNVYQWSKTDYKYTPVSSYEDLKALNELPKATVGAAATIQAGQETARVIVKLKNLSDHLAFRVRAALRPAGSEDEIRPVIWSDNYIDILPGEAREITARIDPTSVDLKHLEVAVDGWTVGEEIVPVGAESLSANAGETQSAGDPR
jgi:exo-1,4-beta-D-glucosaminidase